MKKFKIIVPSFLAIIVCLLIITGSTLALFTSESTANIAVTSGKVNVSASISELELYSATIEQTNYGEAGTLSGTNHDGKYYYDLQENGEFANSGTAIISGSTLTLDRVTPGDKVKFNIAPENGSNVTIKYRVRFEATESSSRVLLSALKTKIGTEEYEGLESYRSEWKVLAAPAPNTNNLSDIPVEIVLPIEAENEYQGLNAGFRILVEAVQGNANTVGEEQIQRIAKYVKEFTGNTVTEQLQEETKTVTATSNVKVTTGEQQNISVGAVVDNEKTYKYTYLDDNQQEQEGSIDANETSIKVSDLYLNVEETTQTVTVNADIELLDANGNKINNLTDGQGAEQKVTIQVYVGKGFADVKVKHNGNDIPGEYDTTTGYVTFETSSFSPFTFVAEYAACVNGEYYATLGQAFEAANNSQADEVVVDILRTNEKANEYLTEAIFIHRSMAINGHGFVLNTRATRAIRIDTDEVTLIIDGWDIDGHNVCERAVQLDSNKEDDSIYLRNMVISGMTYYSINVCSNCTNTHLEINNCSITGWGAVNLWSKSYSVIINNSYLNGVNDKTYNAQGWNDFGTVILEGDTTGETDEHSSNISVTINNSTIAGSQTKGNRQYLILFNNPSANNIVNLNNCNFVYGDEEHIIFSKNNGLGNKLYINGIEYIEPVNSGD